MRPQVSVIMPTYDTAPYLREAIDSVLGQTFADFEFVIVDDGSTDGSSAIIDEYAAKDPRIVVIRNPSNKGTSFSLNRGHEAAQADIVAIMGSDDVCLPTRLEKQLAFLRAHPDIALVGASLDVIDAQGRTLRVMRKPSGPERIRRTMFYQGPHAHNVVMYRMAAFRESGEYRERFRFCQDVDFYFRLVYSGHRTDNIPEVLVRYRIHDGSTLRFQKEKARMSLDLKRDAIARFNLRLTPAEWLSMYVHYALDMLLTGTQKQRAEAFIKRLFFA